VIELLDLTSLEDDDTPEVAEALCARAAEHGTAAVCVMPFLVAESVAALADSPVKVATVANFPRGDDDPAGAVRATSQATAAGADEVDVVAPYRAFLAGDPAAVSRLVNGCRAEARALKVIVETGALPGPDEARELAKVALAAGADFVKTSTGKIATGATPEGARALLEAVREHGDGGLKVAGGVRTRADAQGYVDLATAIMGEGWVTPDRFRIGASRLLDELLADE
jgi:deoxyribose-phosphate aldolase